jgi:hypothetical protein
MIVTCEGFYYLVGITDFFAFATVSYISQNIYLHSLLFVQLSYSCR